MESLAGVIADLIFQYVPPKYVALIAVICGIGYPLSEYLGGTERFKANTTIQAVGNGLKALKVKLGGGK